MVDSDTSIHREAGQKNKEGEKQEGEHEHTTLLPAVRCDRDPHRTVQPPPH